MDYSILIRTQNFLRLEFIVGAQKLRIVLWELWKGHRKGIEITRELALKQFCKHFPKEADQFIEKFDNIFPYVLDWIKEADRIKRPLILKLKDCLVPLIRDTFACSSKKKVL